MWGANDDDGVGWGWASTHKKVTEELTGLKKELKKVGSSSSSSSSSSDGGGSSGGSSKISSSRRRRCT